MLVRAIRILVLSLLPLALVGCGSEFDLAPVSGRVTLDGQPVTSGQITFLPDNGPQAMSPIAADGTFRLSTVTDNDGALVGHHQVMIFATEVGAGSLAPASFEQELEWAQQGVKSGGKVLIPGEIKWLVPQKYSNPQTSDLTADVKAGENTIEFNLKSPESAK